MSVTAIIVQGRIGSTRLPGKVMKPLSEGTILAQVLRRCRSVANANVICCAIPESAENDPVAAEAGRAGVAIFRGDEFDVLARYHGAAAAMNADVIMRVTSDCPAVDPDVCAQLLDLRTVEGADYACNNDPRGWPHGLDCEAFTFEALDRARREATDAYDREHVTPFLRRVHNCRRAHLAGPGGVAAEQRWTLDTEADYRFLTALFERVQDRKEIPTYNNLLRIALDDPELVTLQRAAREAVAAT